MGSYKWGYKSPNMGSIGFLGVVISGVISPLVWVLTIVALLLAPLITNPEPPSRRVGPTLAAQILRAPRP